MQIIKKIKQWYNGGVKIKAFTNDPDSGVFIGPLIHREHHWSAKIARTLVDFYLRHWQWLWGTAIALAALYVAILSLK